MPSTHVASCYYRNTRFQKLWRVPLIKSFQRLSSRRICILRELADGGDAVDSAVADERTVTTVQFHIWVNITLRHLSKSVCQSNV